MCSVVLSHPVPGDVFQQLVTEPPHQSLARFHFQSNLFYSTIASQASNKHLEHLPTELATVGKKLDPQVQSFST